MRFLGDNMLFETGGGDRAALCIIAEAILHGLLVEALYWGLYDYTGLWGDLFALPSIPILIRSAIRHTHALPDVQAGRMEGAVIDMSVIILSMAALYTYGAIVGIPMMWAHAWAAQP